MELLKNHGKYCYSNFLFHIYLKKLLKINTCLFGGGKISKVTNLTGCYLVLVKVQIAPKNKSRINGNPM